MISLPSGVFKPYAGVSTAILVFTKTSVGGTDRVLFYDVSADGWSLDDKRQPLLPDDKLGPTPTSPLTVEERAKNNLPDLLIQWTKGGGSDSTRSDTSQGFYVSKSQIVATTYDLSLNRYKEIEPEETDYEPPARIIAELKKLEGEITDGIRELESLVS